MSMTKMECACSSAWDEVKLDGTGQRVAEAMNAGCTALELLHVLYYGVDKQDLPAWLCANIEDLLKEWN